MARFGRRVDVVGRHPELAVVSELFVQAAAGAGALLIRGDAGVGKSTLWRAGIAVAQERDYQVLACQPAEAEAQLSFAAVADLLDPVLANALPQLPSPQRRALETVLLQTEADEPADERAIAFGLLSVLRTVVRSGAVLVAVDDWQWLDLPSARVLGFVLRRLHDEPVRVLATVRTGAAVGVEATLMRNLGEERLTSLRVEPLSLAALHQLVAIRVGVSLTRRTLLKIQGATAGNMVFALEIARVLAERTEPLPPGAILPVPATLDELVADRVAELSTTTQEVLLAASALAQPTVDLLYALDDRWRTTESLTMAVRAELVSIDGDRVRFRHPLIAGAVYADAQPARLRALHQRLAAVVTDPGERARHLALAVAGPSEEVADALENASTTARARGAPDTAAELCELAAGKTLPDQHETRRRRLVDAAELHFVGGDRRQAQRLLDQVRPDCPPGPERARVLRLLGEVRYHDDSFPEAGRLLRLALAEAGADLSERTAINYGLAYVAHASERVPVAAEYARAALRAAEDLGDHGLLAEVLAVVAILDFMLGRGLDEQHLRRALELEDITRRVPAPMRPSAIHGALMSWTGRPEEARASLEGIRARLLELGDEAALPFLAFVLAPDACVRGDLVAAERYGREGLEAAARLGTDVFQAYVLTATAYADAYAGRTSSALDRAGRAVELFDKVGCRGWAARPLSVLGFVHLSLDDPTAAATVFRPLLNALPTAGVQEPAALPFVPDVVQALVMLGDLTAAEPLLDWFEQRGRELARPWALATGWRCRALVRAARGDGDGAQEAIDRAVGHHERLANPVEHARTLLMQGQLQRRANQRRRARDTLDRARSMFDKVGAAQWSRRAGEELDRLGLRRPSGSNLTPREWQVAEHAAAGSTNNEIAAALFISSKTVEANLARVYRKLGISSRAELGARMAARKRDHGPPR